MVKVLVFGYATGVFSSRKIERRLCADLAFRMLGAGNFPKHHTIRDFRAMHLKELADVGPLPTLLKRSSMARMPRRPNLMKARCSWASRT